MKGVKRAALTFIEDGELSHQAKKAKTTPSPSHSEAMEGLRLENTLALSEKGDEHIDDEKEEGAIVDSKAFDIMTNPAKTWPFKLDDFQIEAIKVLERGEHVLVAAHTSAGKTVVAEYAIALALRQGQRVIYTSPIKALSNQKFRDFTETFADYPGSIGLMTGDTTKNPNAACLVMTTEIMRNFLYKGHELIREVKYVIFDEVHYMKDKERGVIWEESIILLNTGIQIVFLSATISNRLEFAAWVMYVKGRPCCVVSTDFRPVPLEHYVYPPDSDGLFLIKDQLGNFMSHNFERSRKAFEVSKTDYARHSNYKKNGWTKLHRLLDFLRKRGDLPAIVFSFKRREVEHHATTLEKLCLNTEEEQALVENVFNNAINLLGEDDRNLTSIKFLLPLLKRGIGIHHSGLLPILKEITEILFQEGLIKVLFATETFAMGVNMPAKVVVFSDLTKYDGVQNRWLKGGEYCQMSGRAGRRGIDEKGICILFSSLKLEEKDLKEMISSGQDYALTSSFRLSWNMILNLRRVDFATSKQMIDKSFHSWVLHTKLPNRIMELEVLKKKSAEFEGRKDFQMMDEYFELQKMKDELFKAKVHKWLIRPEVIIRYLSTGRLIRVNVKEKDWGWGVVLFAKRRYMEDPQLQERPLFFVDVLMQIDEVEKSGNLFIPNKWHPSEQEDKEKEFKDNPQENRRRVKTGVVRIGAECIREIGLPIMVLPPDLTNPDYMRCVFTEIEKCKREVWRGKIPAIDPFELPLGAVTRKERIEKAKQQFDTLDKKISHHPFHYQMEDYKDGMLLKYMAYKKSQKEIEEHQEWIDAHSTGLFMIELEKKSRVLRRLGFIDDADALTQKGLFGCCIESVDELVMTETVFEGIFNDLSTVESIAFLAAVLPHSRWKTKAELTAPLRRAFEQLQAKARKLWNFQEKEKVKIPKVEDYLSQFEATLVPIVLHWVEGGKFVDCMAMTNAFEGNIVRMLRRIEELLRQLVEAVKAIGNEELTEKFSKGEGLVKRGIAFAASLYIEDDQDDGSDDEDVSGSASPQIDDDPDDEVSN